MAAEPMAAEPLGAPPDPAPSDPCCTGVDGPCGWVPAVEGMEVWEVLPDGTALKLDEALPQSAARPALSVKEPEEPKIRLLECRKPAQRVPRPVHLHMPIPIPIQVVMPRGTLSKQYCHRERLTVSALWSTIQSREEEDDDHDPELSELEEHGRHRGGEREAPRDAGRGVAHALPSAGGGEGGHSSRTTKRPRPPSAIGPAAAAAVPADDEGADGEGGGELDDLAHGLREIQVESPPKRPALRILTSAAVEGQADAPRPAGHRLLPPPPPSPIGIRPPEPRVFKGKRKLIDDLAIPSSMEVACESAFHHLHIGVPPVKLRRSCGAEYERELREAIPTPTMIGATSRKDDGPPVFGSPASSACGSGEEPPTCLLGATAKDVGDGHQYVTA
ncbi:hypothetical protein AB1Y20_010851 [Prymnesium parvum]|uniref:Uncharacterized protein n=1 Tax=Prymnesium parvum TaxID=97485 RepID=A0AB34ITY8_PRYPA